MTTNTTFDDFKNALASVSDGYCLMPGWDANRVTEALASAPAQPLAMTDERVSLISRLKAQSVAHRYEAETDSADLIDEGVAALSAMTDLLEEARDTIAKLLIKIRRDAPDSAGRLLGYADQVVARVDAALDLPLSAQAAPKVPECEDCAMRAAGFISEEEHDRFVEALREAKAQAVPEIDYKRMFESAVVALAEIDSLLGVDEDGCNDPQQTVSALKDYIAMTVCDSSIGSAWRTDSSLEKWFPLTAETNKRRNRDAEMAASLMKEAADLIASVPIEVLESLPLYRWPLCDELGGAALILRDGIRSTGGDHE